MNNRDISAMETIAIQCSHYDRGERECDFCHVGLVRAPWTYGHRPECAIWLVMLAIEVGAKYSAALESVKGHGVTLPMEVEASMSEDYLDGYRRGVDSQRRIAMDALK